MKLTPVIFCALVSINIFCQTDMTKNHDIILTFDKFDYYENEDIILNIALNFINSESVVLFTPYDFIASIEFTNSHGKTFMSNEYLGELILDPETGTLGRYGTFFHFSDSIIAHEYKILKVNLNKDFSSIVNFFDTTTNKRRFLYPGDYTVRFFPSGGTYYYSNRMLSSNVLQFRVLHKK